MTFGSWPDETHNSDEQKKRLEAAKCSKTTPSDVDRKNKTGVFPGRDATYYETTLESCTCVDFSRRKLPCKHIYRLAIELGALNETAKTGINKNILDAGQISLNDAVVELEKLNDDAQKIVLDFLYRSLYLNAVEFSVLNNCSSSALLNCTLLKPIDAPDIALQLFKRNQIVQILDAHNIIGFKRNASHKDLIIWCLENVADIWNVFPAVYVFRLSAYFQKARKKAYTYLCRKYEWETFYNEEMRRMRYPYGAKSGDFSVTISVTQSDSVSVVSSGDSNKYFFPDDEITQLLTYYGHNRCLNGFCPELDLDMLCLGKSFVFSGDFSLFDREKAIAWLESQGAKITGSLSAKTNYLVIGQSPNNGKLRRAEAMGIPVLSEQEFLNMMQR